MFRGFCAILSLGYMVIDDKQQMLNFKITFISKSH